MITDEKLQDIFIHGNMNILEFVENDFGQMHIIP